MDARISRIEFSKRQRQVLALIAQGYTTGQIALALGISRRTVLAYSSYLRNLVGAGNNAKLVDVCWRIGVLPLDEG
ncbi:MAG: helix-turn-helix transcriptional regulator [Chloroflexota bacterium]